MWNALEKLAVRDPEVFPDYYANAAVAAVADAWLGPGYQVTSQVNVVHPGGRAQVGHRDYHLGFLPAAAAERYPEHVHRLSPVLTLQGAVAHVDMPVETGPTLYPPHSQKYGPGYLARVLLVSGGRQGVGAGIARLAAVVAAQGRIDALVRSGGAPRPA